MSEEQDPIPKQRHAVFDDALRGHYSDHDEFRPEDNQDYRSLAAESVGSLILGFLSILTVISGLFVVFPILGVILGVLAIRKILNASEVLSGLGISSAGVALSVIFGAAGLSYQFYLAASETPAGFAVLDFAKLSADPITGKIAEEVLNIAYKRDANNNIVPLRPKNDAQGNMILPPPVFIEGYMYPTKNMQNIDYFMLVPSLQQSRFETTTRNPTAMVEVSLLGGQTLPYRTTLLRVGGRLFVNENYTGGQLLPYKIEAETVR